MTFLYLKAVHIIFVVTWFAGLFYMPRLLVHLIEANEKSEPEKSILIKQLKKMASGIMVWNHLAFCNCDIHHWCFHVDQPTQLASTWIYAYKINACVFFIRISYFSPLFISTVKQNVVKFSSTQIRFWNEVATLFLISIVFLIVLKNALSIVWGIAGLLVVTFLIMMGIRIYKKYRK